MKVAEVTTTFKSRVHGQSKFDLGVFIDLFEMILDKVTSRIIPSYFLMYIVCGGIGLITQIACLWIWSQFATITESVYLGSYLIIILLNFWVNNTLTFRHHKIRKERFLVGLVSYFAICMIGLYLVFNSRMGFGPLGQEYPVISALAAVWNFFLSKNLVWRVR